MLAGGTRVAASLIGWVATLNEGTSVRTASARLARDRLAPLSPDGG